MIEKIIKAMKDHPGRVLPTSKCGFCGYVCGYFSNGRELLFDPGCFCASGDFQVREWKCLTDFLEIERLRSAKLLEFLLEDDHAE